MITRYEIKNVSLSDITGFCKSMPAFLTGIVLKVTMTGGRYLYFTKKRRGKNVSLKKLLHSCEQISCVFCHRLQKYPLQLDYMHVTPRRNSPEDISPPFF